MGRNGGERGGRVGMNGTRKKKKKKDGEMKSPFQPLTAGLLHTPALKTRHTRGKNFEKSCDLEFLKAEGKGPRIQNNTLAQATM